MMPKALVKLSIFLVTTIVSLCCAEMVTRELDGYRILSPTLVYRSWDDALGASAGDSEIAAAKAGKLPTLAAAIGAPSGMENTDILDLPKPQRRNKIEVGPVATDNLAERVRSLNPNNDNPALDNFLNVVWNSNFISDTYAKPRSIAGSGWAPLWYTYRQPLKLFQFKGSEDFYPRYRFLPSVVYPDGLITNSFGWRGRHAAVAKPAQTIRIVAVGASTTVEFHNSRYSYPDLIEHWLNLWATKKGYDVKFEVLNAGREGVNSSDIRSIVKNEVILLAPDYVIYYEGANQFDMNSVGRLPAGIRFGEPSQLVPVAEPISPAWPRLRSYSAILRRVALAVDGLRAASAPGLPETAGKPQIALDLPTLTAPLDRQQIGSRLFLDKILSDLDAINDDLKAVNGKFVMSTYRWMIEDGIILPARHRFSHTFYNVRAWPFSYRNFVDAIEFQNRVFRLWAQSKNVPLIDIASRLPADPDLFIDTVHNSNVGIIAKAWIYLNDLTPTIEADILSKRVPTLASGAITHPGTIYETVDLAPIKSLSIDCVSDISVPFPRNTPLLCLPKADGNADPVHLAFRWGYRLVGSENWNYVTDYVPYSNAQFSFALAGRYEITVMAREFFFQGAFQKMATAELTVVDSVGDDAKATLR